MAKISLTKVAPVKTVPSKVIKINNIDVTVQQYLPIEQKTELINLLAQEVFDDNYIASPVRLTLYFYLGLIQKYTNISLTPTMMQNGAHTYDLLRMNGVIDSVQAAIPEEEFNNTFTLVMQSIEKISQFYQSILGVLKISAQDYQNTAIDTEKVMNDLKDPDQFALVREIMTKMN